MSSRTVLVIDDSATIRKLVDTHLSPEGYRVVLAPNAEEGLALAAEIEPDLVLLDHQLPGTTGHQVATQLSQNPALAHTPVVISSTLRKKAYAEYIDLDNVVDMLLSCEVTLPCRASVACRPRYRDQCTPRRLFFGVSN